MKLLFFIIADLKLEELKHKSHLLTVLDEVWRSFEWRQLGLDFISTLLLMFFVVILFVYILVIPFHRLSYQAMLWTSTSSLSRSLIFYFSYLTNVSELMVALSIIPLIFPHRPSHMDTVFSFNLVKIHWIWWWV